MKVFDGHACRLGNAIFRYMASSLFCIIYNATRTYNELECVRVVTEEFYRMWCNSILHSNKKMPIENVNYKFNSFYQTDVYKLFRNELIQWVNTHPNDSVNCEDNPDIRYSFGNLLSELSHEKKYDVVVHIRLEDFVLSGEKLIIHPTSICNVLDTIKTDKVCFVCNKITTDFEKKYMNYFKSKYDNIVYESNDVVTDFKIMNNAKILICSLSTLCWSAGFLSKTIECAYFPKNRYPGWYNQSFSTIIQNTIVYDNMLCNENELTIFLDNHI